MVGGRTFGQRDRRSKPRIAISILGNFCLRPSGETLKNVGPFYMASMPGEVKYPTQGVNVQHAVDSISHEPLQKCP